jgi:S-phase kinase-associated protein 1
MSESKSAAPTPNAASGSGAAAPSSAVLSLDADENPLLADTSSPQTITLISKEGKRYSVSRQALMQSELCKTTLEGDKDATEIPLYHIEGPIVAKVIEYLSYHQKVPPRKIDKPLLSNNLKDIADRWDVNFLDGGESAALAQRDPYVAASNAGLAVAQQPPPPSAAAQEMLFKLLLAANYLNIKSLLSLTCAKVASLMKGKTPDQIRTIFNIRNDYTQAEEEEVRKEYKDLIG